jgi:hypothetical protein
MIISSLTSFGNRIEDILFLYHFFTCELGINSSFGNPTYILTAHFKD